MLNFLEKINIIKTECIKKYKQELTHFTAFRKVYKGLLGNAWHKKRRVQHETFIYICQYVINNHYRQNKEGSSSRMHTKFTEHFPYCTHSTHQTADCLFF